MRTPSALADGASASSANPLWAGSPDREGSFAEEDQDAGDVPLGLDEDELDADEMDTDRIAAQED